MWSSYLGMVRPTNILPTLCTIHFSANSVPFSSHWWAELSNIQKINRLLVSNLFHNNNNHVNNIVGGISHGRCVSCWYSLEMLSNPAWVWQDFSDSITLLVCQHFVNVVLTTVDLVLTRPHFTGACGELEQ